MDRFETNFNLNFRYDGTTKSLDTDWLNWQSQQ